MEVITTIKAKLILYYLIVPITLICSFAGANEIYWCKKPDGSTVVSNVGCGAEKIQKIDTYVPQSAQSSESGQPESSIDRIARDAGFSSYQDYLNHRSICLNLLQGSINQNNPSACGSDLNCIGREGERMLEKQRLLAGSPEWRNNNCDTVVQAEQATRSLSAGSYRIEASNGDELFVINGEKYSAKSYCFDMEEGDEIVFADGSPNGVCVSATLVNKRNNNVCEVWCE